MATPFRLKRSAVTGKRPGLTDLQLGELALNTYDGSLFVERDTGGVGIATTIANITPWKENYGSNTINYIGVVSATTYHGNQVIGTPTNGSFRSGAFNPTANDFTKDNIDELNYILGKLVPTAPDTINGVSLSLTGTAGNGRLCQGFTPTNNTGGSLTPSAGTQYTRNTDSTITTNYITEYGPGDSGTVTGFVNAVGVGTTTLNISFGLYAVKSDNGTYGALQINNDKDAVNSSRNTGITSLFYEVYDVRLIATDGFERTAQEFQLFSRAGVKILSKPPIRASVGSQYNYPVKVWRQKPDQKINYKLFYGPDGMSLQPDGTIGWTPNKTQVDSIKYAVIASHGVATDTQFVNLFVNHPPIIRSAPMIMNTVQFGLSWDFELKIEEPNKDDRLVFTAHKLPQGMRMDPHTGYLRWEPTMNDLDFHELQLMLGGFILIIIMKLDLFRFSDAFRLWFCATLKACRHAPKRPRIHPHAKSFCA